MKYLRYLFYILFIPSCLVILSSVFNISKVVNEFQETEKSPIYVLLSFFIFSTNILLFRISALRESVELKKTELDRKYCEEKEKMEKIVKKLTEDVKQLEDIVENKDFFYDELVNRRDSYGVMHLSSFYADYCLFQYDISAKYHKYKKHPAPKKAQDIKELKAKTKEYIYQFRLMQYKYEELLCLFPELKEYVDDFESLKELENIKNIEDLKDGFDKVRDYVSKEEYLKLSNNERNQLALNRYISGKKSCWQIGRDYELFVGHWLRKNGFKVWQFGIEKKLEDLGCDIIAVRNNIVFIIQCKRWKEEKKIHEKHIMHLYGTSVVLKRNYKQILGISLFNEDVVPYFISIHEVTDVAKEIAKLLNVELRTLPFEEFPRIKCNIGKDENGNETKIYHLPFDQQYDRTKIENSGEFYAWTVEEAVSKGFRRAFKHYVEKS